MTPPRLRLREVALYQRDTPFRMPFTFGATRLEAAPQAFVAVRIETDDGREAQGMTAELMVPKWFDKDPVLTNEENFGQLRLALERAAKAYEAVGLATAFGHAAATHAALTEGAPIPTLAAAFGPAELDKAVLDGLCRAYGVSVFEAVRANLPGIEAAPLAPDIAGFDLDRFLAGLKPAASIAARHTVGMTDPLTEADLAHWVDDGLPETLEEVIAAYGQRYFKIKIRGELEADLDRLKAIAAVLDRSGIDYRVTLDGNEQYDDADGILALWRALEKDAALAGFAARVLFIEQPVARAQALSRDIAALAAELSVIIDESDAAPDAFLTARRLGYAGVSSKACKGLYKSLLNAARCAAWNAESGTPRYFLSGEDLTCQAGLAVQQDLALVSLLGLGHVERNGHHYVHGMAGASPDEEAAFLAAHRDLYQPVRGRASLAITDGRIALGSLACTGFASGVTPHLSTMRAMERARSGD